MYFLKKVLLPACVIIVCFQSTANANEKTSKVDVKKIEVVIEAFRMSLIDKNKSVFINLFYNETVPWLGVASAQTIALAPPAKEGERQRPKISSSNYLSFIDWIVSTPKAIEEKFWDVKILQDGDIASVHFKYSFHQDNKKTNWGDEAWHLVRTEQGWKITSVIYSINIKGR
jgi:hypothetical protein